MFTLPEQSRRVIDRGNKEFTFRCQCPEHLGDFLSDTLLVQKFEREVLAHASPQTDPASDFILDAPPR